MTVAGVVEVLFTYGVIVPVLVVCALIGLAVCFAALGLYSAGVMLFGDQASKDKQRLKGKNFAFQELYDQ